MKIKSQNGFAHILLLVVIGIVIIGALGATYIRVHNASDKKSLASRSSATSTSPKTTAPISSAAQKVATTTQTTAPASSPTPPSTPATPKPKTDTPPLASPPSNIVHPTIANCTRQNFDVYASVTSGTPAYNGNGLSQVLFISPYGSVITNVYCDSADSGQMVFRCENATTVIDGTTYPTVKCYAYRWSDVSLTKP